MDKVTNDYRLTHGAALIKECSESGLSKADWCSQHNIPLKTYYYWQRKVRNSYAESLPASLPTAPQKTSFAEIVLASDSKPPEHYTSAASPDVIIRTGTLTIEVSNNASKELIAMIRSVVKYAAGK